MGLLDLLREANHREGGAKGVSLVVQGGGMRGIYSMAALTVLEELGLVECFDHALGASAGALNAGYYLAGQSASAVGVYLDRISNRKFVSFLRPGKVVNVDFLVDDVLVNEEPLDLTRVRGSPTRLHILLTEYETARSVVVTSRDDVDLMEAFRASAALPILYDRPIELGGTLYLDGGVSDSVPLMRALSLGSRDIVVVLTRPVSHRRQTPTGVLRWAIRFFSRRYPAPLRESLLAADGLYNRTMEALEAGAVPGSDVRLHVISPSSTDRLAGRTTTNRSRLVSCAQMARNDMRRALGLGESEDNPFE